ncbi:hypothetical protein C8Q73DRAFT_661915 [Cubamyces lactineus]|nr:hypothetical protein C8Q73DRAFT_661915 [Cubamyces lactineus]
MARASYPTSASSQRHAPRALPSNASAPSECQRRATNSAPLRQLPGPRPIAITSLCMSDTTPIRGSPGPSSKDRSSVWYDPTTASNEASANFWPRAQLFQCCVVVVDYYEADGSVARKRFVEADVRPVQ